MRTSLLFGSLGIACFLASSACTRRAPPEDAPVSDLPKAVEESGTTLAGATVEVPPEFHETGVLERRAEVPKNAPEWAAVSAQVTTKEGRRFLVTTGYVRGIRDVSLARSAAEDRARAQLARWTKSERLLGSTITAFWRSDKGDETLAQAELEVPPTWTPGEPLSMDKLP